MIEGCMSINEIAEKLNLTIRGVHAMCSNRKIEGGVKLGKESTIPVSVARIVYGRTTSSEYVNGEISQ